MSNQCRECGWLIGAAWEHPLTCEAARRQKAVLPFRQQVATLEARIAAAWDIVNNEALGDVGDRLRAALRGDG